MNRSTLSLGLIGYPVGHSLSPVIHEAVLRYYGLAGKYELYAVPPLPEGRKQLRHILSCMRRDEIQGLNVTIPHKSAVIQLIDDVTEISGEIGAVNTIVLEGKKLVGANTDIPGFMKDLERVAHSHFNKIISTIDSGNYPLALVLGAGGAARAVVYGLIATGWNVVISSRRKAQARAIKDRFKGRTGHGEIDILDYDQVALERIRPKIYLLVNTTPLGMEPDISLSPWPENIPLPGDAFIYDLIYKPAETRLLQQAHVEGLPSAGGIGMLVEQAALSFELWTGKTVPRKMMFSALPDSLLGTRGELINAS